MLRREITNALRLTCEAQRWKIGELLSFIRDDRRAVDQRVRRVHVKKLVLGQGLSIDQMKAREVAILDEWAAAEGWNPGLGDLDVAWGLQPDAFIALRNGDELVGAGTIFDHGGSYGFMGLFIVIPALRGHGLGEQLWTVRRDLLRERLGPDGSIGMDGVLALEAFYARGGFIEADKDIRMEGYLPSLRRHETTEVSVLTLDDLEAMVGVEAGTFPVDRTAFLRAWIDRPGVLMAGVSSNGHLSSFVVARPCRQGFKIGPFVASSQLEARSLVAWLGDELDGERVQWDIPSMNDDAMGLAQDLTLSPSFACARMYLGQAPPTDVGRLYGVTSFEFG